VTGALQQDTVGVARRVDGRVARGTRQDVQPVANQWVVLHRVGSDRAGPLDSTRTSATGHFSIRYKTSGDSSAVYFVSTTYGGVAYFTSPLRAPVVSGDDAMLMVFDTTSRPVTLKLGGRHVIVGLPGASGRRPIGEVYDIQNDTTVTLVARDSLTPVWSANVPAAATGFQLNTSGELAAGAISRRGTTVGLYVPLSPGIRQIAFTYELPASAFPLTIPVERPTGVFELLIQEPTARVEGPSLREMAPVTTDGRVFRRFLAQDLSASAVMRIDMPRVVGAERERVYFGVGIALLAAMVVSLVFAARRHAPRRAVAMPQSVESRSRVLIRTIAALDADFERAIQPDDAARETYAVTRASLKSATRPKYGKKYCGSCEEAPCLLRGFLVPTPPCMAVWPGT